jgi:hypothetical protein
MCGTGHGREKRVTHEARRVVIASAVSESPSWYRIPPSKALVIDGRQWEPALL